MYMGSFFSLSSHKLHASIMLRWRGRESLGCGQKEEGQVILVVIDYTGQQHLRSFLFLQVLCKNRRRTQKEERMEGVNSKTKNNLDRV
jgi:hypothetical protein